MKCPKCGLNMKSQCVIDDNWRMYKCWCGYEAAKHIHSKVQERIENNTIQGNGDDR